MSGGRERLAGTGWGAGFRRFTGPSWLVPGLCAVYVVGVGPFTPGFFTQENVGGFLLSLLPLFVLATGQTVVMISGGIDLSLTSVVALASVTGAAVMNSGDGWLGGHLLGIPIGVLMMLGVGGGVGLINGVSVAVARMPSFIVTLTTMMFFSGLAIWLTQSQNVNGLPSGFNALGGRLGWALGIVVLVGAVVHMGLSRLVVGRWLYAVGHNERAARISGVPVVGVTVAAYVASGVLGGVAGVLLTGQAETGSPTLGQRMLLDVVAATVIGGTSLFGGKGRVIWTLFGVIFIKLLDNTLNLLDLSYFAIMMVKGGVILGAATLDAVRARMAEES